MLVFRWIWYSDESGIQMITVVQSGLEIRTRNTERRSNTERFNVPILSHFCRHFIPFSIDWDGTKNIRLA